MPLLLFEKFNNNLIIVERGAKLYLKSDRQRVEAEYAALKTTDARRVFVEEQKKAVKAIAQVINGNHGQTFFA